MDSPKHSFLSLAPVYHQLTVSAPPSSFLSLSPVRHQLVASPPLSPVTEPKIERSNSEASDISVQYLRLGHVDE